MAIPGAVQRAADEAEQALRQMYPQPQQDDSDEREESIDEGDTEAQATATEEADDYHEDTEPAQQDQSEDWEQKYRVLQGKYNAEVPRISEDLRRAHERIQTLEQQLQQALAQMPQRTQDAEEGGGDPFESLADEYPDDLVSVLKSQAQQIQQLTAQLQNVQGQTQRTTRQTFESQLAAAVPDWQAINNDQNFIKWLSRPAPYMNGVSLHNLLSDAYQRGDVQSVAKFFTDYQAGRGARKKISDDRAKLIEPGSARSNGTNPTRKGPLDDRTWNSNVQTLKNNAAMMERKEFDRQARELLRDAIGQR